MLEIWSWQIQEYLSRDQAVRESRLCPDFGVFTKRLDVFMHTFDSKFRYMITIIIVAQNDPINHQAGIQSGSLVFSPRRTCPEPSPSSPSWFWTSTSTTPTSTFLQLSRPKRGFWARRKGTCWPPESEPAWQIHLHQIVCWPFQTHACYTFSESYHLHLQV